MFRLIALLFSWLTGVLKVLRGGHTFLQFYLAILLGLTAGMMPGFTLWYIVSVALLLILNVNGAVAVLSYSAGVALKYALAPLSHSIGATLLHIGAVTELARWSSDFWLLALLDLSIYSVLGSLPLIALFGGAVGWYLARELVEFREFYHRSGSAALVRFPVLKHSLVRWWTELVIDERKGIDAAYQYATIFAFWRIFAALFVFLWIGLFACLYADTIATRMLRAALESVTGARAEISGLDFSPLTGALDINHIGLIDPNRLDFYSLTAYRLEANLRVTALLKRQIVVEKATVEWLRLSTPRTAQGIAEQKAAIARPTGSMEFAPTDARRYTAQATDIHRRFSDFYERLREYQKTAPHSVKEMTEPSLENRTRRVRLLSDRNEDATAKHAAWVIESLELPQIELAPNLPLFTLKAQHVASHPAFYPYEMAFTIALDPASLSAFSGDAFDRLGRQLDEGTEDIKSNWQRWF